MNKNNLVYCKDVFELIDRQYELYAKAGVAEAIDKLMSDINRLSFAQQPTGAIELGELKKLFNNCTECVNDNESSTHWQLSNPIKAITVKEFIDIILRETTQCLFSVSPTKCEWYNGNCYTVLDANYNVLSNNINRNDIAKFYHFPVYSIAVSDNYGYIKVNFDISAPQSVM